MKKQSLLIMTLAAVSLTACATTGSSSAPAQPMLQVTYPDDSAMDCPALGAEIGRMDQMMGEAIQAKANAEASGQAASTAAGVGVNAALYSGALGRVPGLGLAANAAGGLAQQRAVAEAERREQDARTAELRRTHLNGMYAAKNCASGG